MSSSSVQSAQDYIGRLIENESKGWGDQLQALKRVARRAALNPWTLERIRSGRAKTVTVDVMEGLRMAYIASCARKIAHLQIELEIEQAKCGDDDFADLEAEIAALADKVAAAKERLTR